MRKYMLAGILLILLFSVVTLFLEAKTTEISTKLELETAPTSVQPTNITIFNEDLVLKENEVMLVKDARFELDGSLLMKDNATLILENAQLIPIQRNKWGHNYTLLDNARLILKNNSCLADKPFLDFIIYGNSSIEIIDSNLEKTVNSRDNSRVHAFSSNIRRALLNSYFGSNTTTIIFNSTTGSYIGYPISYFITEKSNTTLLMVNSTSQFQGKTGEVSGETEIGVSGVTDISNSKLRKLYVQRYALITDSSIDSLAIGSTGNAPIYPIFYLINSTYNNLDKSAFDTGTIYIEWYLTVAVKSANWQPIKDSIVQVYFNNGSLAAQQKTPSNGTVQFTLPEKQIRPNGTTYFGDYIVKTNIGNLTREERITLNKNLTIELKDNSEFPTTIFVIASSLLIAIAIAILTVKRKSKRITRTSKPPAK